MAKNKVKIDLRGLKGEKVYVNRGGRSYKAIVIDNSDGLIIGSDDDDDDNTLIMTSPFNRKTKKQ